MPRFVAIIGGRESGKSTIIRSLTGCPTNSYRGQIVDRATGHWVHVICSSPQEQSLTFDELQTILATCAAADLCEGVIMAVQPNYPYRRLSLERVFEAVEGVGRFRLQAYLLQPGYHGTTEDQASIVERLRRFRVTPIVLDARRFAFASAQAINRRSHLLTRH